MFTKSFVIWVVEELIGIFYPWLLLKAQTKGNQRHAHAHAHALGRCWC